MSLSPLDEFIVANRIAERFCLQHRHQFRGFSCPGEWWNHVKASLALSDTECDILGYAVTHVIHSRMAEQFDLTIDGFKGEITKGYWWELLLLLSGGGGISTRAQ